MIPDAKCCDTFPDCAKGEDEYYCYISDPVGRYSYRELQYTQLEDMVVYPPITNQDLHRRESTRPMRNLLKKTEQ